MTKKILTIQFRQDVTKEHEQQCINRVADGSADITYIDIFDQNDVETMQNPELLLKDYDKLILGGSAGISMGPDHEENDYSKVDYILEKIEPLMKYILEHDYPTFGTCFGHQLLGHFLGSPVDHDADQAETGFAELHLTEEGKQDKLFAGAPDTFFGVVGHQDSLRFVPDNTILLTYSDKCKVHCFRYKENVYGTQFHGELTEDDLIFRINLFPQYRKHVVDMKVEDSSFAIKTLENFLKG
jgi:GMP synthase (glutamine-hydrolysing)